jgi:hypothetical protein
MRAAVNAVYSVIDPQLRVPLYLISTDFPAK